MQIDANSKTMQNESLLFFNETFARKLKDKKLTGDELIAAGNSLGVSLLRLIRHGLENKKGMELHLAILEGEQMPTPMFLARGYSDPNHPELTVTECPFCQTSKCTCGKQGTFLKYLED